jgi:hypothetical protein
MTACRVKNRLAAPELGPLGVRPHTRAANEVFQKFPPNFKIKTTKQDSVGQSAAAGGGEGEGRGKGDEGNVRWRLCGFRETLFTRFKRECEHSNRTSL